MPQYRKPTAVVLTDDGVYYNSGRQHPLSPHMDLDDLSAVLAGAARAFHNGEGVVVLDRSMIEVERSTPDVEWHYTKLRPWTTFLHKDGSVVHLGLLRDLEKTPLGPLLRDHMGPEDIAYRLGRYAEVTGCLWRYTAGVTGCSMLRKQFQDPRPGRQPLWNYFGPRGMQGCGPMIWRGGRQPGADDAALIHGFDINAMYLAALKNAHLAWGRLQPYTGPFDHTYAGWWEIDARDIPVVLYDGVEQPPVFPKSHVRKGTVWLTTPVVKYLMDLGLNPQPLVAHVDVNAPALARQMAERLTVARVELAERGEGDRGRVLPAIKRTYAELVGMMAREGGTIYRPDWAATVQDLARMNMLRRLDRARQAGYVPFAVKTDAAYFLTEDPAARTRLTELLGVGTGPGSYKYIGTRTASDYVLAGR